MRRSSKLSTTLFLLAATALAGVLVGSPAALAAPGGTPGPNPDAPGQNLLVLKQQGTFYVGGTIEYRSPNSSITVTGDPRSLPGNIAVHQMYVEYQVPNNL